MSLSSAFSTQAQMLTPAQLALIEEDYAKNPNPAGGPPTVVVDNKYRGPLYAGDQVAEEPGAKLIGPIGLPPAAAALAEAGALSRVQLPESASETPGALSAVKPREQPIDINALLRQYVPEDDSQSKYLALAAGLLAPTRTGRLSEQVHNVAAAMQQQRAEQEKTRAHYIPLIMQQVAAQQAREEQNMYRLEAQRQAQQAQEFMAMQSRAERAHQNDLQRQADKARADADRTSRENIEANKRSATTMPAVNTVEPVLGVPVPTVLPWANQSSQVNADKVRAAEVAHGTKEVEADADQAKKLVSYAQDAQRFMQLNQKVDTGGITDKFAPGRWVQSFGPEYAEMQAITAKVVPTLREPGSGSTSDFDMRMFERGTIGVDKPKPANDVIAQGYISRAKNAQDYADFRATYLEQNGTLQGANKEWSQYLNSNPIFDPTYPEVPRLNDKRVPWRDYFAAKLNKAPAQLPGVDPVAAAKAELARRQGAK